MNQITLIRQIKQLIKPKSMAIQTQLKVNSKIKQLIITLTLYLNQLMKLWITLIQVKIHLLITILQFKIKIRQILQLVYYSKPQFHQSSILPKILTKICVVDFH